MPTSLEGSPEAIVAEGFNGARLGLLACLTFLAGGLYWTASVGLLTISALKAYPMVIYGGGTVIVFFVMGVSFWTSRSSQDRSKSDPTAEPFDPPCTGTYDSVTGLPTNRLFSFLLKQAFMKARKQNLHFAVILIEMDPLAPIAAWQEKANRHLLYRVQAARVKSALPTTASVARLTERTFAVLLDHTAASEEILSAVRKILAALSLPFVLEGQEIFIGSRIGISLSARDHENETALFESAAKAVAQARTNACRVYGLEDVGTDFGIESLPTIAA